MKKASKIFLVGGLALTGLAMKVNHMVIADEAKVNLDVAIKGGLVNTDFSGNGSYSGQCLKMNLTNKSSKNITITVPAGTMFKPSDDGAQNILVPEDQMFVLKPGETKLNLVRGFCCEASDKAPSENMKFTLSSRMDAKMKQLYEAVKGKHYPNGALQEAIWCVSDGHAVSNVYADGRDLRPLKQALYKITGQKETWYNTPQNHTVDDDGNISHETTSVNGLVKFSAQKTCKVHNEIWDGTKLKLKNPNEFNVPKGNVEYDFEIKVKGWEKGTYFVKVFEDEKVIHTQEFKL